MNISSARKSFWIVMGFATPIFLLSAIRLGIAPLLPQFKQSFGAEYGVLSLIPTAFFLSTVLLAAPLGHLAMQIGLHRCALSIVGLVILSSLLCAATDHLWLLIVFLFVMGMALSAAFPLARTAVDMVYAPGAAGRAMMLIGFPGMIGSMLGGILFGRLAEQMGWRNSFVVFAVVGLLLGVFSGVVLFRREYRPRPPERAAASSRSVLKNRALWLLSLAKGGGYAAGQGVFTFALPMLMDAVGYSPLESEMNSPGDNPLFVPEEESFFIGGNFHGQPTAMALDYLCLLMTVTAGFSERGLNSLLNPALSHLPDFLTPHKGLNTGLMVSQYTAASLVAESRILSHPASVNSIPVGGDQEDYVSMGLTAARKSRQAIENLAGVLAIEAIAAAQALEFHRPHRPGIGTTAAYSAIRQVVPPLEDDRPLYPDIEAVCQIVSQHKLLEQVETAIGELESL